ncbi:hypothetical protein H0H93_000335, partial [Arthromyces matolae]
DQQAETKSLPKSSNDLQEAGSAIASTSREAAESKDPRKVEGPEQPSIAKPPSNIEASDQESRRTASATLKTLNPTGGLGDIAAKDAIKMSATTLGPGANPPPTPTSFRTWENLTNSPSKPSPLAREYVRPSEPTILEENESDHTLSYVDEKEEEPARSKEPPPPPPTFRRDTPPHMPPGTMTARLQLPGEENQFAAKPPLGFDNFPHPSQGPIPPSISEAKPRSFNTMGQPQMEERNNER